MHSVKLPCFFAFTLCSNLFFCIDHHHLLLRLQCLCVQKARLQRYTDAEDAARERARKLQLAREEAEFLASIGAWVSAGQGDVVEKTFTAVAEWQVRIESVSCGLYLYHILQYSFGGIYQ